MCIIEWSSDVCSSELANSCTPHLETAIEDSYKRLLKPSIETEFRLLHKNKADEEAIAVFSENLRQLLLAAPLGPRRTLALDPGYRTGCKVVVLDEQGNLLENTTVFPRSEEHTSELQSLMRSSYAVFCLKTKR